MTPAGGVVSGRLAARGVSKAYGAVQALTEADIALEPGEVHAIVGENGAGKSTLAKILAGSERPDRGLIELDGALLSFRRRKEAIARGIGYVPQALSLVGDLTLVENMALARPGFRAGLAAARRALEDASHRTGLSIALDRPVARLAIAERQLGEVLVALADGARILLLDEPTSMLGPREVERLVRCLRDLAGRGVAIGLVTHRIAEVLQNADRLTVLRGGYVVHQGTTTALDADSLARLMIGERSRMLSVRAQGRRDTVVLDAQDITAREHGVTVLNDVSLQVHAGEILGVAGVASASQPVLAEILAGLRRPERGSVRIERQDITGDAAGACRLGVAHVPGDRGEGIVPESSIAVNASLLRLGQPEFRRFGLRRPAQEARHGRAVCADFNVQPALPALPAFGLSGGNQQKLMVGRELERAPPIVIAHSPTQGLDLAATAAMHNRMIAAAENGAAIVAISADLDEIVGISDRLVVLSGGRIVDEMDLRREALDITRLGNAIAATGAAEPIPAT